MLTNFISENFRLKTDQICEGLTAEQLNAFIGSGVTHHYKKGDVIFREGGIPTGLFYVKAGRVKKYKNTVKGGEQIFYICVKDELLGYHALLGEEYYTDSAAAIENSEITFIPKDNFLKILRSSTVLSNGLLKALGHEFSLFTNSITNLATKTARERLAFTLLILDEKFKISDTAADPSEIILSRTDLANMVGTAKETVVKLLHQFKDNKLIATTGKSIRIINRKGIIKEANFMGRGSKNA
jgi:CRP-like cAMP-binding protein